jgi:hypothetical protein
MPWVKVDVDLLDHFKTRKVADMLGILPVYVGGHLQALWSWSLKHRPDGDLTRLDAQDIAWAAQWPGDPQPFLDALLNQQFLEQTSDGRLFIHDWLEYSGQYQQAREATRQRVAAWRERKRAERESRPSASLKAERESRPSASLKPETPVSDTPPEKLEVSTGPTEPVVMGTPTTTLPGFEMPGDSPAQASTRRRRKGYASEPYWIAAEQGLGRKRPANQRGQDDWNRVLLDLERAGESPETVKLAIWHYRNTCPEYALTITAATKEQWIAAIHQGVRPPDPASIPAKDQKGEQRHDPTPTVPRGTYVGGAKGTGFIPYNAATAAGIQRRLEAYRQRQAAAAAASQSTEPATITAAAG